MEGIREKSFDRRTGAPISGLTKAEAVAIANQIKVLPHSTLCRPCHALPRGVCALVCAPEVNLNLNTFHILLYSGFGIELTNGRSYLRLEGEWKGKNALHCLLDGHPILPDLSKLNPAFTGLRCPFPSLVFCRRRRSSAGLWGPHPFVGPLVPTPLIQMTLPSCKPVELKLLVIKTLLDAGRK